MPDDRRRGTAWALIATLVAGMLLGALLILLVLRLRPALAGANDPPARPPLPALAASAAPNTLRPAAGAAPAIDRAAAAAPPPPSAADGPPRPTAREVPREAAAAQNVAPPRDERKERLWAKLYKKPPQCDEPSATDRLVECANHFIRARREFEQDYAAGLL